MVEEKIEDMVETGINMMALIQKAKEEGIDEQEYDRMMEKGLTDKQKDVVEERVGEGRIRLTGQRPQTADGDVTIPTALEQLAEGKKMPWIITLDGVDFVVKTSIGAGSHPHSEWWWREDGYKFTFYKSRTDDTVHSISIYKV